MILETIYLKSDSTFSTIIAEWATSLGVQTVDYDFKSEDLQVDGLLLINANQDIEKDLDEIHSLFDLKHFPTQKIDVNGTLQVAVSSFEIWLQKFKCKRLLILGSEKLAENENLTRFLARLQA
jgi:hypothetical protein